MEASNVKLSKSDFETDQDVRWCPGCGDYSILATVQRFLPSLGIPRENYVFISGIGCSSRFPYYMNTYGFHSIHGRAPAIATGIKVANPDLSVWLITGDGDALSIGGNHFIHLLRRNVDINVLLFNNRIYGLTKGQYSPTSEVGKKTKSSPYGSPDQPLNPIALALGAQGTFVSRTLDVDSQHMTEVLKQAVAHRGTSFVEIYQNCNIFNDGAFESISNRAQKDETQLKLEHGKPMIFGAKKNKGLRISLEKQEVIEFNPETPDAWQQAQISVFDRSNRLMASALARLDPEDGFPVPMGVFYQNQVPTFDAVLRKQGEDAKSKRPQKDSPFSRLHDLFHSGDTWVVS